VRDRAPADHRHHQVWSWDITYLATTVRGAFCYPYLIMDV
jgi:transposase InsO family protein